MRRYLRPLLAVLAVALLAALVTAPADAGRTTPKRYCTECGSLQTARGAGVLRITGRGVSWGTITSGRIIIRDRSLNHHHDWSVRGQEHFRHTSDGRFIYSGSGMRVYISSRYTLAIRGRGVSTGTVAIGRSYVRGAPRNHGSYHLNGGPAHRWPLSGRRLVLKR
jgi:hypothetical protein